MCGVWGLKELDLQKTLAQLADSNAGALVAMDGEVWGYVGAAWGRREAGAVKGTAGGGRRAVHAHDRLAAAFAGSGPAHGLCGAGKGMGTGALLK
jgi:hypothetical protein